MKKYEQIDISGDVCLRIWGKNLEELFENASEGMFDLITNTSEIKESERREVVLSNDSNENLFIQWLNELVFLFDTYGFIGKAFKISIQSNVLKANISGGLFDPEVNESRLLVKAATYHNLSIIKADSHWEAKVIFDI
jgi:SHS2 domain-containing protein